MRITTPNKYLADHSDEWLAKETPNWFASLKKRREDLEHSTLKAGTVKSCPSFVDIFRNSLVLRAPCDFVFTVTGEGENILIHEFANSQFINVEHHDLSSQIEKHWGDQHINIKLNFQAQLLSDTSSKCLILPPEYHFEEGLSPIQPMLGVINLLPNLGTWLNINMIVGKQYILDAKEIFVRKRTPLAYIYFPFEERVAVEYVSQTEYDKTSFTRTSFGGDYLRAVMKGKENGES